MVCVDRVQMTAWDRGGGDMTSDVSFPGCLNNGCMQQSQRPKHLFWEPFSHISRSVKINLKELSGLKGASWKQQFFSGYQLIIFLIVCENVTPTHSLRTTFKYGLYYGNRTPTKSRRLVLITTCSQSGLSWVARTRPGEVLLSSVWIICVDIRALLYLPQNSLTHVSRLKTVNKEYFTFF